MYKKLLMAFAALTALAAFALPATASATNDPTLTDASGHVAVDEKIVGTNVGNTLFTNTADSSNLVTCNTATMTGKVLTNSNGTVKGTIENTTWAGTDTGGDCTGTFGPIKPTTEAMCINSTPAMATHEFQVFADDCASKLTFTLDVTGVDNCVYEATGAVKGTITNTNSDSAELKVKSGSTNSGAKKTSGSFLCPSSGALTMTFNLYTDTGTHNNNSAITVS